MKNHRKKLITESNSRILAGASAYANLGTVIQPFWKQNSFSSRCITPLVRFMLPSVSINFTFKFRKFLQWRTGHKWSARFDEKPEITDFMINCFKNNTICQELRGCDIIQKHYFICCFANSKK